MKPTIKQLASFAIICLGLLSVAPPAHTQSAVTCVQALADPQIALRPEASPWQELRPTRQIRDDQSNSAPQSIALIGAPEGSAATGQTFAVPSTTSELFGSVFARFSLNDPAAEAAVRLIIYAGTAPEPTQQVFATNATYASGPADSWRRFDWELTTAADVQRLRTAGTATFVLELVAITNGTVWLDDLTANVCSPSATLSGRVTQQSLPEARLAGATLMLARTTATGTEVVLTTQSDATGAYSFTGVSALNSNEAYQIWYTDAPPDPSRPSERIGVLAGPVITQLAADESRSGLNLALDAIQLDTPAPHARLMLTRSSSVTLRWTTERDVLMERQQACIYDPQRINPATGRSPEICGPLRNPVNEALSFTLTPATFAAVPAFGFTYGRSYNWYVRTVGPTTGVGQPTRTGRSFFERTISFVERPLEAAPSNPITSDPGLPIESSTNAEWTLLIYAAADNALSDPRRTAGRDRVDRWVNELQNLAAQYPNVQIVSLLDRYGPTGIEQCYFRATAAADCRLRPEANSASAVTLTSFVTQGLQRYPAERAALVLIGPGHSIGGFGTDESSPDAPVLSPANLAQALQTSTENAQRRLDLVLAQAPLLGEIDLAASLAPAADYLVAAPDQIWQVNLLPDLLPLLTDTSTNSPAQVATALPELYTAAVVRDDDERALILLAFNLRQAANTLAARETLATALRTALRSDSGTTRSRLDAARLAAQAYDASANGLLRELQPLTGAPQAADEDALVDLGTLATQLAADPLLPETVRTAAENIGDSLSGTNGLVIARAARNGTGVTGEAVNFTASIGPAIFLPGNTRLGNQPTLSDLWLHRNPTANTLWAALLRELRVSNLPAGGPGSVQEYSSRRSGLVLPIGGQNNDVDLYLPMIGQ